MKSPFRRSGLALLAGLLLTACAGSPSAPEPTSPRQDRLATIQTWLATADTAAPAPAARLRLKAARELVALGKLQHAREALRPVQPTYLDDSDRVSFHLLQAELAMRAGNLAQAEDWLTDTRLIDALDVSPPARQVRAGEMRANLLALQGRMAASARERIFMAPLIRDEAHARANHDAIWHALMSTSLDTLMQQQRSTAETDWAGWLSLAVLSRQNPGDLDAQVAALDRWQTRWSEHPAARRLPGGLAILHELARKRPRRVAIILPTQGRMAPLGRAIREGLLAAWYRARQQGARIPELRFYSLGDEDDFLTVYYQALQQGAEQVIGPLDKQRVRLLFDEGDLPVPTLALNAVSDYGAPPANLYQFSLSGEQEARQIARRAKLEGHTSAMIIYPEQPWGQKMAWTFMDDWQAGDGILAAETPYADTSDLPKFLKQALQIDRSEARRRALQQATGLSLEFEPRRRQDVDAIALIARPAEARLIRPMLDFLYAGNVPVYASSHIYTGRHTAQDSDLSGVRFCDMPWVLDPDTTRTTLEPYIDDTDLPYLRLYALGADAYLLHPRLPQLARYPASLFQGHTGRLSLNGQRQIQRALDWAEFRSDRVRRLPALSGRVVNP